MRDADEEVRTTALDMLAKQKDSAAQEVLVQGLRDSSAALVPPGKAIQMLGYDVHSAPFPVLREYAAHKAARGEVRQEALRILAADPDSQGLLESIFENRGEEPETRAISGTSLQALNPAAFERHAERIVMDDSEDDQVRATCISALGHFPDYRQTREKSGISEQVRKLEKESSSEVLRHSAEQFLREK
jgi:hypothetical protein